MALAKTLISIFAAAMVTALAAPEPAAEATQKADEEQLARHVTALQKKGKAPLDYVLTILDERDLVLFDDALHNAVEPWEFYTELVRSPAFRRKARYIFLEVIPSNRQGALDAYFGTFPEDRTLLYPAFQDRYGWSYKTYFDFLHTVYEVNRGLPPEERLKVRAVSTPSYWKEMERLEDWTNYNTREVIGRDYAMYRTILADLGDFNGEKGVFLTNTRHAYTDIRQQDGAPFWNTGTFFRQWHAEMTWSIRLNAPILNIEMEKAADGAAPRTGEGLERYSYSWARVAQGLWDSAFKTYGATPVAIDLTKTPFGEAAYMGNHMHKAAPGQTMADAYDGVVFLTPFEDQHSSASVGFIYTPAFKKELARRYRITHTPAQIETMLKDAGAESLEAYIETATAERPEAPSPQAADAGPMDAWRKR